MRILSMTFMIFLTGQSVQALSCHKCPQDSSFNDCLTNITSVTCEAGWSHCFSMKVFVRKSSGEEIIYLDKQCGLDFVCNHPDPNFVCNFKNTTFTSQGHTMVNCTSRCCTTNMCNNDDLPPPPSTPVMTHLPSNQTGTNTTVVPSTPQTGITAAPADCGKGSINTPQCMTIALAVVFQLSFKLI